MGLTIEAIRAALRDPSDGVFRDIAWLEESYLQPEAFNAALLRHHAALDAAPQKSDPASGYDLYHDLVLRHATSDRTALYFFDADHRVQRLSYAQLHARCSELRSEWMARGVSTGERLLVLAHLGEELLVPLFTALRMGLEVSILPPAGPDFLTRRLRTLAPQRVAMAARYLPLLGDAVSDGRVLPPLPSPRSLGAASDATSHTYAHDAVALRLFSPAQDPPDQPVEVTAAAAFQGALRDGLLLLALVPGQVVATAGQDLLQVHPALLFAVMIRGAALLDLRTGDFERDLRRDDPLSSVPPISVLFVSAALRATLLQATPRPIFGALRLWVINPQEPYAPNAWQDWVHRFQLQGTAAMSLLLNATCGGSVLFSLRRLGGPTPYLMPAPGLGFRFLAPDDSGEPARTASGMYRPTASGVPLLLLRKDGGYLYAGTRTATENGRVPSRDEVEAAVQTLAFVQGASVITEPSDSASSTLLVFTGPETQAYAQRQIRRRMQLVQQTIIHRLSPDYLPARIIVTSQLPRLARGGGIDHVWCAQMLLSGELRRRSENPVCALLDRLLLAILPRAASRAQGSR